MGAPKDWAIEKRGHAEALHTALTALVGDVASVALTGASLSWRTAAGQQGHWREERGQIWVGRIVTDPHGDGTVSVQLVLDLDSVGEDDERVGLAHPIVYHQRSSDDLVAGYERDTPPIYTAALTLLTQLGTELRTVLPWLEPVQEAPT